MPTQKSYLVEYQHQRRGSGASRSHTSNIEQRTYFLRARMKRIIIKKIRLTLNIVNGVQSFPRTFASSFDGF